MSLTINLVVRACVQLAGSGVIEDAAEYDVALQYTALLSSLAHPHYYSVQLDALWVGGQQLPVRPVRFSQDLCVLKTG
jgi:hypothetical protein